jgi:hypothetical protein
MGEFYNYLPLSATQPEEYCSCAPKSDCNPKYGDSSAFLRFTFPAFPMLILQSTLSVGRGAFTFTAGQWTTVSQRIRLNDVGQSNGELELFVEGVSKISVKGLTLRVKEETKFRGIIGQTFFGGEWLSLESIHPPGSLWVGAAQCTDSVFVVDSLR